MSSFKVGQTVLETVTASDGSTVNPSQLVAVSDAPGVVQVSQDGTLVVTAVGVGVGVANVTFNCPGFKPVIVSHTISDMATLVVTDGAPQ